MVKHSTVVILIALFGCGFVVADPVGMVPSPTNAGRKTYYLTRNNFSYARFINQPGYYLLKEPITFLHSEPAIVIDSDDVILDLGNNELKAPLALVVSGDRPSVGVRIEKSRCGVVIMNGIISNFFDNGIDMSQNSNIALQNLTIANSRYGVYAILVGNLSCSSLALVNTRTNGFYGENLSVSSFEDVSITTIADSLFSLNEYTGFYLLNPAKCSFNNCSIQGVSAAVSLYGFNITAGNTCVFNKCTSSGNTASNCIGFYITGGQHNKFIAINASGNSGNSTATSEVVGCLLDNGEQHFQLLTSTFSHNSSQGGAVYGIKLGGTTTTLFPANGIIRGNEVALNKAGLLQYGIKDFSKPTSTAYFTNKAIGQGRTFTRGSTMVDTGKMNYCIYLGLDPNNILNNIVKESSFGDQTIAVDDISIKNVSYYLETEVP